MRRLVILTCCLIVWMSGLGQAGAREDYEQAYKVYIAAGACMAAYSDRYGGLANRYLEQNGWKIEHYEQTSGGADARFLVAKHRAGDGREMYVLAIVGTENARDVKTNLKVDKVYFAGSTLDEFEANSQKDDMPATAPKVHRGYHQFVQAALTASMPDGKGEPKPLSELLLADKNRKIYLVGHSLGGAAATLAGARLVSMGVLPEQIEIITFGAPAVGNAAFADQCGGALDLTRVVISGDPVTGALQTLVGGYKQFGREVLWEMPATADQPHRLAEYGDLAIKKYYDQRQQALASGEITLPSRSGKQPGEAGIYIAPLRNNLPEALTGEFWYMQQALADQYRELVPGYLLADAAAPAAYRKQAAAAGCKWLIIPEVRGYRAKQEKNVVYYITLDQTVYDVSTGAVASTVSFSMGTYNLTPLEAFIHDSRGVIANQIAPLQLEGKAK
ncbi:MAG TPA: lipase family protein [Selenomonadales bacterium]|nr:lipase family protein [Selenomonadales bacterium]